MTMNKHERRPLRTTIKDLEPGQAIRPLSDSELRLATGGQRSSGMTTDLGGGVGATDDVA
jgi:hypothetical protein